MPFFLRSIFFCVWTSVFLHSPLVLLGQNVTENEDPWRWLEEVDSARALEWARAQNSVSQDEITNTPDHHNRIARQLELLQAKDRLILPYLNGRGRVSNFWQDAQHVRGIIRTTTYESYLSESPQWELLLDIDALAEAESENWIYAGASTLDWRLGNRSMIALSRGGADARVYREFDTEAKRFVAGGFTVAEGETQISWLDADRLMIATSLKGKTKSGYARTIQIWKRGENFEQAETVFEAAEEDLSVSFWMHREKGVIQNIFFTRALDFYRDETYLVGDSWNFTKVPKPDSAEIKGIQKDSIYLLLREDWKTPDFQFKAGSLVELNMKDFSEKPKLLFEPDAQTALAEAHITDSQIYLNLQRNVTGELWKYSRDQQGVWSKEKIPLPELGDISLLSAEEDSDDVFVVYSSFLQPTTLYRYESGTSALKPLKQAPARLDASSLTAEQRWAVSKDGTRIPYFVIRPKEASGPVPTILYGYGGFEISLTPYYLGGSWMGAEWLRTGGAYVIANIRGGGEFGPDWHRAALKENRQRAYDDFIAVAEDLVSSQVTTPSQLGIHGGSNGGLLVGATFTQRPDLCGAVVCSVPLLDMLRYHLLLKGHSWMGEYGDPGDPQMRDIIKAYSPYHNIPQALSPMPRVLFMTSTRDDRVHPGHARKMAAQMLALGHRPLFFENLEGGHGGAANLKQRAEMNAMTCSFFMKTLGLIQTEGI